MRPFSRHDDIAIKMWFGRMPKEKLAKQLRCTEDELTARAAVLGVKDKASRQDQQTNAKPARVAKPEPPPKPPKVTPPPKPEPKPKRTRVVWTPESEADFAIDYPDTDMDDLVKKYGGTKGSLHNKACVMGLKKSPEFRSRMATTRQRSRREQLLKSLRCAQQALNKGNIKRAEEHIDRALQALWGVV